MYRSLITAGSGTVKLIFTNWTYQLEFEKFSLRIKKLSENFSKSLKISSKNLTLDI